MNLNNTLQWQKAFGFTAKHLVTCTYYKIFGLTTPGWLLARCNHYEKKTRKHISGLHA